MLVRTDPFRELERLMFGTGATRVRPAAIPMDAFRKGDEFVVTFDLPGVSPESIDVNVERNVLTVRAERPAAKDDEVRYQIAERPTGTFTRRVYLGETLDRDGIQAGYDAGVLTLRVPVVEKAQSRKIAVTAGAPAQIEG
ncbi:Hsp20/alpha crystallin family protein [Kutzneria kofuensis]|uniref:HSP20 family protein n=1 Tax=Kutzneria kofuensis TaxID=103725 RepID=A0A7W9KDX6_9PSEU|nr:Hsp20/alpha crystallin family protein [Kutzneria kofuensis]MBB5890029.1 HSP20 family protein [Kutzneria kofuensis]